MVAALAAITFFSACKKDTPTPTPDTNDAGLTVIEGEISNEMNLDASKKYLLKGKVYVLAGAKLNVPAGTIIFGDKETDGALIVNRGGQLNATGTADKPVIFTSEAPIGFRNRGDWGGIVLLGNAITNSGASSTIEGISGSAGSENGLYGPGTGSPINDQNSGTLTYVRIEFAGIDLSQDNELNSLTMGAVGSGTTINHVMISYANDDAFEWFGGTNNMSHLITYSTLDDDFDTDKGYTGKIQYGLVVRDKYQADNSGSRAFEASSSNTNAQPSSAPVFANITVLGPRMFSSTISGNYKAGIEINSNSNIKVLNSVITGFPTGVSFNGMGAEALVSGCVFSENTNLTAVSGNSTVPADFSTVNMTDTKDKLYGSSAEYNFSKATPFLLSNESAYKAGAPDITSFGFVKEDFYGAFGTSASSSWNFGSAWVNFDPINAVY